jgi:hypothetical protein
MGLPSPLGRSHADCTLTEIMLFFIGDVPAALVDNIGLWLDFGRHILRYRFTVYLGCL